MSLWTNFSLPCLEAGPTSKSTYFSTVLSGVTYSELETKQNS